MVVKILDVFPMVSRDYVDKDGRQQTFLSKGFIMMSSKGAFYAEAVQEWASHWEKQNLKKNHCADVSISTRCRDYTDNNGNKRYSNEITISNMILI